MPSHPVRSEPESTPMSSVLTTTRAELYKTRHHRLPYVVTALGAMAAAAPGIYFMFRPADSPELYTETVIGVAGLYLILAAAIFGGWILGHEYRQHTLRRVVAVDASRPRVLAAKAIAGSIALSVMSAVVVGAGFGVGAIAAAMDGSSLGTADMGRQLAAVAVPVVISAVVAFGASAAFRSDTYATLAALGLVVVFSPLLALIPTVGPYTLGALMESVTSWVGTEAITPAEGATTTVLALGAWLAGSVAVGGALFARRDL